jgi:hypothetical protein
MARKLGLKGLLPGLIHFLFSDTRGLLGVALLGGLAAFYASIGARGGLEPLKPFLDYERSSVGADASAKSSGGSLSYLIAANKGQLAQAGSTLAKSAGKTPQKESENAKSEQLSEKSTPESAPTPQETVPEASSADSAAEKANKDPWRGGVFGNSKPLGFGNGLAGGSGLAGGILRSFEKEPSLGKPKDFKRNLKAATLQARALRPAESLRGPLSQLRFASRESLRGRGAASAETRSFHATRAFEATPAGASNNILGAQGLSQGGEDVGVLGGGDGGPINYSATPVENPPPVKKEKDQTPYNNLIAMGVALLMTASTIILIEGILAALGKIIPPLTGIALMLMGVAAALAAAAAGMGAMVANTYGQQQQGLVLTVGGSITTAAAIAAMVTPPQVMPIVSVLGGVAGIVSAVLSLLMGKRV